MDVVHVSNATSSIKTLAAIEDYFHTIELVNTVFGKSEVSFKGETVKGYLELYLKPEMRDYSLVDIKVITAHESEKGIFREPASSKDNYLKVKTCPNELRKILKVTDNRFGRFRDLLKGTAAGSPSCILKKRLN
jgi:hypothetical protein